MNSRRLYFVQLGLICLLVLSNIGGAYGIGKLLEGQSDKLVAAKAKIAGLEQQQHNLVQAKKDITTYSELYTISKRVVPANKDQAQTVRQIIKLASDNDISIGEITFPASSLGATTGKAATGATAAPAPKASDSKSALSQLVAVPGISGVYKLEINVVSDSHSTVSYPQLIGFLRDLESNRLTAEVDNIIITPSKDNSSRFTFNVQLSSYIKP